jgi:hypothetical protein
MVDSHAICVARFWFILQLFIWDPLSPSVILCTPTRCGSALGLRVGFAGSPAWVLSF